MPVDVPVTPRITLRLCLLTALIVAANVWVLLQFGLKLGSFFIVELVVAVVAALVKVLTPKDQTAVAAALQKVFYGLIGFPFLVAGYLVLLVLTLNWSTVVVKGETGADTCIERTGRPGCVPLVTSDEKSATFFARTAPVGLQYSASRGEATAPAFTHWPWMPSVLQATSFVPPPAVLVRVPYPHSAVVGGVIEIRDESGKLLASAETSAQSAALLLGRNATPQNNPEWAADLPGISAVPAAKARERWSNPLRSTLRITPQQKLTAAFRTDAQRAADPQGTDPASADARAEFTVQGGTAVQDVILRRTP